MSARIPVADDEVIRDLRAAALDGTLVDHADDLTGSGVTVDFCTVDQQDMPCSTIAQAVAAAQEDQ